MNRIVKKIEDIMTDDDEGSPVSLVFLLAVMSVAFGGALKVRQTLYRYGILQTKRLPRPVVSVGNLTAGGTGKTPMTMHVAKIIRQLGYKAVVMSRGYKGHAEKAGGVVSDGCTISMGPQSAGDEPYMMAKRLKNVPVVVGRNRFKNGMRAVNLFSPDVLVLDDAFQHLKLYRDIDLVLLDCRRPFGNRHFLPRGTLREPISALMRSDAVILTRSDSVSDNQLASLKAKLKRYVPDKPVFSSFYVPGRIKLTQQDSDSKSNSPGPIRALESTTLKERRVFIFSGLADNQNFIKTVTSLQCFVTGSIKFPDHHWYSNVDLENIVHAAQKAKAEYLVTSEKDYVRIAPRTDWPVDLAVIGIECAFGHDEPAFNAFLESRLKKLAEIY